MTAGLLTGSTGSANKSASLHYTLGHEPYLARKESLWMDARGCFDGALRAPVMITDLFSKRILGFPLFKTCHGSINIALQRLSMKSMPR